MTPPMTCVTRPAFPATKLIRTMFQRMLASALFAGIGAGLIAALLHFAFVQNVLLLAEQYETGAIVHFGAAGSQPADLSDGADGAAATQPADAEHPLGHAQAATSDTSTFERNALTVVFTVIVYVAYGFLLVAGFGIAEAFGHKIGPQQGLLWGVAGFAVFQLAPALGLAPELPGTLAADLGLRQIWWWMTVACTGTGLALLAFGGHWVALVLAAAFLALPHLIGSPEVEGFHGLAPSELGAMFSARTLGMAATGWAFLGWAAGTAWEHEGNRT